MIGSLCLAALAGAAFLVVRKSPNSPVDLSIVSVESGGNSSLRQGAPTKAITVEFRRRNPAASFSQNQRVQTRLFGRWQEPERFPELDETYLLARTNVERVIFIVPVRAEACRFQLEYRVGSRPYCQAYAFFQKKGLYRRFPKLCSLVLKCFPQQARLRHVERELMLPVEMYQVRSGEAPLRWAVSGRIHACG